MFSIEGWVEIKEKNFIFESVFHLIIIMTRKFILFFAFLLGFVIISRSQRVSRQDYIRNYQVLAIREMNRSGIPASIKMAQACLESDDGNSRLATMSNNHFGIKCKTGWKGEFVLFDDDAKDECFRKYPSVEDSYIDHTNFLSGSPRYSFLFRIDPRDYKAWARGLKEAGYATAKDYPERLIKIIEDNELSRLDEKLSQEELIAFEQRKISQAFEEKLTINPYSTRNVSKVNRLKAVIVREGDTFALISQEFGINTRELSQFNDYPLEYQPQPNEILYLQKKHRRTDKNHLYHIVGPDETMHYISQLYGIRYLPLIRRNQMRPGEEREPGQKVSLRFKVRE